MIPPIAARYKRTFRLRVSFSSWSRIGFNMIYAVMQQVIGTNKRYPDKPAITGGFFTYLRISATISSI
nr:hypothetical protein [uncultured Methanospirillum sp.]